MNTNLPSLRAIFDQWNERAFLGELSLPFLQWNSRLRTSAGRFVPGGRKGLFKKKPVIEIALYLTEEVNAFDLVRDTMGHEMIHYWLWVEGRPFGHSKEFYQKMNEMKVSRYNSVPKLTPYKYLFRCPGCFREFKTRRNIKKKLACIHCCKQFSNGKFDSRFELQFEKDL